MYMMLDGRFLFMVGPTPAGDRLAVIRLGGHREGNESAWDCAAREVLEESGLTISPRVPPCTYWLQLGRHDPGLTVPPRCDWRPSGSDASHVDAPTPFLIVQGSGAEVGQLSAMYLVDAEGTPAPTHEAPGLLLLRPPEILKLVEQPMTLGAYLSDGGQAIFQEPLPELLPLEPFLQLRVLATLLPHHPQILR
ncbi:MAG: NUDIX domain-containing protein [Chloroflexi bacterium]|nr:NUDIX domain-containing protein [Chloroflexota bacterium]